MAPKKKKEKRKTETKNKSWSKKELSCFVEVLSSVENRDKPWVHVLETLALKKTANESIFTQIREEFKDRRVAEGLSSASGSGAEECSFTISQMRSKFKWLKIDR